MIAAEFDVFLFDLDGVIYLENELLPDVKLSLERLRQMGKIIRFLTNDPRATREQVTQRLRRLGLDVNKQQVYTSGWATIQYIQRRGYSSVFALGTPDFLSEMRSNLQQVRINTDNQPQAVVIGYDDDITMRQVNEAVQYIQQGSDFIATNGDTSFPVSSGRSLATGSLIRAVQAATGRRPVVIGKPSPVMFQIATEDLPANARIVMIGDSPETDILGAHGMGYTGILISEAPVTFPSKYDFRAPDVTIRNLSSLFDPAMTVVPWSKPPFPWPERVEPGVAAVVFNEQGDVLLMKRIDNGLWGIPSGHVEPGETVEEAIKREVMEETGLEVTVERLIGVYSHPASQVFSYPSGDVVQFITLCFLCRVDGGSIRADRKESAEVKFFNPAELPADMLPMHPQWLMDALASDFSAFIR